MKKLITLLFTVILSNLLVGAEISELQMAEAKFFAAEAKKQFNLPDSVTEKVLQLKVDSYVQYREKVYSVRKAGDDAKADAAAKEISNKLMTEFVDLVRCKGKDYWAFAKATKEKFEAEKK